MKKRWNSSIGTSSSKFPPPKTDQSITNDRETMKMFHSPHIDALTTTIAKRAHHNDAKTMETFHRLLQA